MSTFSQLCADVVIITNRPELVEDTKLAVRNAVQFYHLSDFWMRDMLEDLKQWTPAQSLIQLSIRTNFTRWRKFSYIKKFDLDTMITKEGSAHEITEIAPTALFDSYDRIKKNKYYVAGDNFNLRLSTDERALLVGWWAYPDTTQENFQSWIADIVPAAIAVKAASEIFVNTGMVDEGNRRLKESIELWLPIIQRNDIEAQGR